MSGWLVVSLCVFGRTTFDTCSELLSVIGVGVFVSALPSIIVCALDGSMHPENSAGCCQRARRYRSSRRTHTSG